MLVLTDTGTRRIIDMNPKEELRARVQAEAIETIGP